MRSSPFSSKAHVISHLQEDDHPSLNVGCINIQATRLDGGHCLTMSNLLRCLIIPSGTILISHLHRYHSRVIPLESQWSYFKYNPGKYLTHQLQ